MGAVVIGFIEKTGKKVLDFTQVVGEFLALLGEILYGLLTALLLEEVGLRVEDMVGEGLGACLRALVKAALVAAQEGSPLCSRAFEPRKGTDVAWGEYAEGRRQNRLVRGDEDAWCLCKSRGRVLGGLMDGSLLEWDVSTLEAKTLHRNQPPMVPNARCTCARCKERNIGNLCRIWGAAGAPWWCRRRSACTCDECRDSVCSCDH